MHTLQGSFVKFRFFPLVYFINGHCTILAICQVLWNVLRGIIHY